MLPANALTQSKCSFDGSRRELGLDLADVSSQCLNALCTKGASNEAVDPTRVLPLTRRGLFGRLLPITVSKDRA